MECLLHFYYILLFATMENILRLHLVTSHCHNLILLRFTIFRYLDWTFDPITCSRWRFMLHEYLMANLSPPLLTSHIQQTTKKLVLAYVLKRKKGTEKKGGEKESAKLWWCFSRCSFWFYNMLCRKLILVTITIFVTLSILEKNTYFQRIYVCWKK